MINGFNTDPGDGKTRKVDIPGTEGAYDVVRDGNNFRCISILGIPYKTVPIPEELR
jgi:hypothetical protein